MEGGRTTDAGFETEYDESTIYDEPIKIERYQKIKTQQ